MSAQVAEPHLEGAERQAGGVLAQEGCQVTGGVVEQALAMHATFFATASLQRPESAGKAAAPTGASLEVGSGHLKCCRVPCECVWSQR